MLMSWNFYRISMESLSCLVSPFNLGVLHYKLCISTGLVGATKVPTQQFKSLSCCFPWGAWSWYQSMHNLDLRFPLWLLPFWDVPQFPPALGVQNSTLWCPTPIRSQFSGCALSPRYCTYRRGSSRKRPTGMALTQCGFLISRFIYPKVFTYFIHFPQLLLWFVQAITVPTLIQYKLLYHDWKSKVQNIF